MSSLASAFCSASHPQPKHPCFKEFLFIAPDGFLAGLWQEAGWVHVGRGRLTLSLGVRAVCGQGCSPALAAGWQLISKLLNEFVAVKVNHSISHIGRDP